MSENRTASGGGSGTVSPTGPDARARPTMTYGSGLDLLNQLTSGKFGAQPMKTASPAQPGITSAAPLPVPGKYDPVPDYTTGWGVPMSDPAAIQARSDRLFGPSGQTSAPRLARLYGPAAGQPGSVLRGPRGNMDPTAAAPRQWRNPFAGDM